MNITLKENETMQDLAENLGSSFELVYDIAPIAYWYENLNEDGRIKDIHFSKRMRDILGYTSVEEFPDELDTLMKFTHPEDVQIMLQGAIDAGTGVTDKYDVQYRIRKADGTYMWCNATGELVKDSKGKTVGMYGAFIDVTEEVKLQIQQEEEKQNDELITGFMKDYDVAFTINLKDGQYHALQEKEEVNAILPTSGDFYKSLKIYVEKMVHPLDRKKMDTTIDEMREKVDIGQSYDVEFRSSTSGKTEWYRGTYRRINEDEILGGFINCDEEHTLRLVSEKLIEEYDAIYVVSLLRGKIRASRQSRVSSVGMFDSEKDYKTMLLAFAETVEPEYKEDWINFSDTEFMKEYMAKEDRREYIYELPGVKKSMRRFTVDVIERDAEGVAMSLLFSFVGIDDDRAAAIRLNRQLAEQSALLDGLAREYHTVWLIETNEEHTMHLYRSTGVKTIMDAVQLGLDVQSYDTGIDAYVRTYVHEDDMERVLDQTKMETVERDTPEIGTYVVTYRRYNKEHTEYDFHQMVYARATDEKGTVNYVFAYRDADKMIREQMEKEIEVDRLKNTEVQLRHEKLRSEVLNYMVDHGDKDPIELLKKFAERIRVLIDCDQVIYRDLEETRIMVNSPAIENTWAVPIEYCMQCEHFDAHHPMYSGGYTEMDNCQEGWQGIPVYHECPIRSSLTRLVYCDGEIAGYLAIHYVQNYHHFTDVERTTLEEFTRILSMSLSRYEARKRVAEFDAVRRRMNMIYSLSEEFDPIMIIDPVSGTYDWYEKKADEIEELTSMSIHGDDFYKDIAMDEDSIIHDDEREKFTAFYSKENLMKILKTGETQETENRWKVGAGGTYLWKYNKVVRMIDEEGNKFVVVGVIDTTEEKKKQEEYLAQKKRIEEQTAFTTYFLEPYESAYYVGLDDLTLQTYKRTQQLEEDYPVTSDYVDSLGEYIEKEVHPEDKERFLELIQPALMKEILKKQPEFGYVFRNIAGDTEKYYNFQVIRGADESHAAFGFKDVTAEMQVQKEQEIKLQAAKDAEQLIESIAGAYQFAFTVNTSNGNFNVFRMDEEVSDFLEKTGFSSYAETLASLVKAFHPGDKERMAEELDLNTIIGRLNNKHSYSVEYRIIRNKATEWHEMSVTHIHDDEVAIGFLRNDTEITKRHIEEIRFRDYFGLYETDLDTGMYKIIINSPYYTFSETLEPVPYEEAMTIFANRQIGETKEFFLNLANVEWITDILNKEDRHSFEYYSVTADGRWVDVTCYVTLRHADGTPAMFALGFSFVSSTEAARQELNRKLNESNQMIQGLASGYETLYYINIKEEQFTVYALDKVKYPDSYRIVSDGKDPFAMLRQYGASDIVYDEDKALFENLSGEEFQKRLAHQKRFSIRYRRVYSDRYVWYEMDVIKYEDIDEEANAVIVGFVNCDDEIRKELEQKNQLQEALSMAQSANRAKTTFLNNMSHDIRTPMNAIIGYTGLAASHIDRKEKVQDYLGKITQSSNHLLSLINDVLDMSRIESGKMNLDEKAESLPEIMHTLRNIVQHDMHAKQHDFFIDTVNVKDEMIVCDKLRLNQVLLNIISNSIKYTAPGGTISMRIIEKTVKSSGYATYEFRIKDNGMGMSEEYLKTIFEPFTRVKSSTMSGIQGTGLGMAITKNIVDMMGGKIEIESKLSIGTETIVTFDFKLHEVQKESIDIPELHGFRALVADDDTNTCGSIYQMLKEVGMRAEWCTSGKEAVVRAEMAFSEGDLFKVYILDWLMPDMNGIETTRRIRKVIGDDVPVIILTAYDWSDIEEEAREAGVTAFVSKPMFPSDLKRVLNECIGKEAEQTQHERVEYNFEGKKILLVEDNELNREIATEILMEDGFEVSLAGDGDEAVEIMKNANSGDFDIVLMDVQMPTIDGYEATRRIRAIGTEITKIPIIAMTANAFDEDRKAALDAGMNEHIAKPIKIDELKSTLAKFL